MSQNLIRLRKQIDGVNEEIFNLIVKRIEIARRIAKYKKQCGLKMVDKDREGEIILDVEKLAKKKKINPELSGKIFQKIIELTKREMKK